MNNSNSENNSCVETPAAPDWLLKLENRREELKRARLGHEVGAGAKCNECGDKCPGLDLHFWRKVCRNCKCRKDQHMCDDDNLSGWAQFEILGQIRSKPAFIKIKALASHPVQLEWVPPNTEPDIVSDYMEKLGTTKIPISGSDAAFKRKQQLEFQVPPHDLDAALCDNLTESETKQLQQYVQKIRENCVGQGSVVRIGALNHAVVGHLLQSNMQTADIYSQENLKQLLNETPEADTILSELLTSDALRYAVVNEKPCAYKKILNVFQTPICDSTVEFECEPLLSFATKQKLCGLNKRALCSLVKNGAIYDKLLLALQDKNFDVFRDPRLGPIKDFRQEYLKNKQFKNEIDNVYSKLQYATPVKCNPNVFNSPLPLKCPVQTRVSTQLRQDTPLRKVKFDGVSNVIYDCNMPANIDYEKDALFAQIINAEPLKSAFQIAAAGKPVSVVTCNVSPFATDIVNAPALSTAVKQKLLPLAVDQKALQSVVLNAAYYDRLFSALTEKGIIFDDCKLLKPLYQLRQKLLTDIPCYEEVHNFVINMPKSNLITYGYPANSIRGVLTASGSTDSGFDSKPTTPHGNLMPLPGDELNATCGTFTSIPGIEDMNMYPNVEPSTTLTKAFDKLQLNQIDATNGKALLPEVICRDCCQAINFGEVAVKAARAGKEIAWHPSCFKCFTCHELLADLVYFFHGGEVYCGRDLAIKLSIPRCKACDELIFTKEYTAAENSTFHIKHFCCYQCDKPLAGEQYVPDEKTNMPLCLDCYKSYFAIVCESCREPIGATQKGVGWKSGLRWHEQCFNCAGINCGKSLLGERFVATQNKPFCSPACLRASKSN